KCRWVCSRRCTSGSSRLSFCSAPLSARSTPLSSHRGSSPRRQRRNLGRVWRDLQRQHVFPLSMSALVGGVCGRRDHLVSDRELRRLIRRYIQFEDLADAAIPLHLVAFDLIEGRELLLSEGPAVEAIAASASIPGIFGSPLDLWVKRRADESPSARA